MGLLIKRGRLINPANPEADAQLDVLLEGERIKSIAPNIEESGHRVIDAGGQYVLPGLIDLHAHLRDPGYEYKEDIASGTRAAARGGFTTVSCMPNTKPAIDNPQVVEYVTAKATTDGVVRVVIVGAITKERAGLELVDMARLCELGVMAFSDDGDPLADSLLMRSALESARQLSSLIISHSEDKHLSRDGVMHEGRVSRELGLAGIPSQAEENMVDRDIALARVCDARMHLAHLSTAGSISLLRKAKSEGLLISGEVCPHHFSLTDEAVRSLDPNAKVNPPLRGINDVMACVEGIRDGVVEVIATDHAPHADFEKARGFNDAPFGISGFETAISLAYTELYLKHKIPLMTIVAAMTSNPARILGLEDAGEIKEGGYADIAIFDPQISWQVEPDKLISKGKNTPFAGQTLNGQISHTIYHGQVVYSR